jgi:hypothetical protein
MRPPCGEADGASIATGGEVMQRHVDARDLRSRYSLGELLKAAGDLAVAHVDHLRPAIDVLHREMDQEVVFSVAEAIQQRGQGARDPVSQRLAPAAVVVCLMREVWNREAEMLRVQPAVSEARARGAARAG